MSSRLPPLFYVSSVPTPPIEATVADLATAAATACAVPSNGSKFNAAQCATAAQAYGAALAQVQFDTSTAAAMTNPQFQPQSAITAGGGLAAVARTSSGVTPASFARPSATTTVAALAALGSLPQSDASLAALATTAQCPCAVTASRKL